MTKYEFDMFCYAKSIIECLSFKDVEAETQREVFCDWVGCQKCYHCEGTGYYQDGIHEGEVCMFCDSFDEKTEEN